MLLTPFYLSRILPKSCILYSFFLFFLTRIKHNYSWLYILVCYHSSYKVLHYNVFDHYDMIDYDEYGGTWNEAYLSLRYDWTHANALLFDENESSIYISVRHLSRITKIDYPSGNIIWNLGHEMPSGEVNMGSNLGFSFQHSLQKLENGNIITFDNGNLSFLHA